MVLGPLAGIVVVAFSNDRISPAEIGGHALVDRFAPAHNVCAQAPRSASSSFPRHARPTFLSSAESRCAAIPAAIPAAIRPSPAEAVDALEQLESASGAGSSAPPEAADGEALRPVVPVAR